MSQALADTHGDPILSQLRDQIRGRKALGQAVTLPDVSNSGTTILEVEVGIDGDSATVSECTIDDAIVTETATGRIINNRVASMKRTGMMRRAGGTWRLVNRRNDGEWEGVAGCASGK